MISTITSEGAFNPALVAGPLSPVLLIIPGVPATVWMTPFVDMDTRRTTPVVLDDTYK